MKKLLFLALIVILLYSCSSDDQRTITEENLNLSIDHYKATSLLYGTAFLASENGSQEFQIPFIDQFDFEPGFRYEINVVRTSTKNAGTNATTNTYRLVAIQSQDTIAPQTRFSFPLARFVNGLGYVTWIRGSAEAGYIVNNEIPVDCSSFCSELAGSLLIEDAIRGEFEHGQDGSYTLVDLY